MLKTLLTKNNLPLILYHLVILVLIGMNFPFGKWFIGWDSVTPELNFGLNFARVFTGFWQENYGVGVIGGHGFSALLPHTVITFLFSFIMPQAAIRPAFTFLCLYLGGLGMFYLVRFLLREIHQNTKPVTENTTHHVILDGDQRETLPESITTDSGEIAASYPKSTSYTVATQNDEYSILQTDNSHLKFDIGHLIFDIISWIALTSALFYILNFGTIQIFYVQLETFIGHFAALPWLFWIALRFLKDRSSKTLFWFFVINCLATLQGFIPSLFIAYLTSLGMFLFIYLALNKFHHTLLWSCFQLLLLTFFINAYWLFPLVYYTLFQNAIFLNSYNNLTSTPHFIDVNRKYGDLKSISLIRGYLWDSFQLGGYILEPWIKHQQNAVITGLGYLFFTIILGGVIGSIIFVKEKVVKSLTGVFLFFLVSIGTNLPIITTITNILQAISPTYQQAFRTAFTKFSIGLSFSYSIFLGVGLYLLVSYIIRKRKEQWLALSLPVLVTIGILIFSFPALSGNLLYKKLTLPIPDAYKEVITYFNTQPDGRIADLPQECAEGWYAYRWGYFGSGFYWYGIKQPFMSRSFDVWSNYNENYYWELSRAIQNEDYTQLEAILTKYDITWVLYDPNQLYCRNPKGVILQEKLLTYLRKSPNFAVEKQFSSDTISPLLLFKRKAVPSSSFISVVNQIPNIGPSYKWNDGDTVSPLLGTYLTDDTSSFDMYLPFRSLFTKRKAEEKEFSLKRTNDVLTMSVTLPSSLSGRTLMIPPLSTSEKTLSGTVRLRTKSPTIQEVHLTLQLPRVFLDTTRISSASADIFLGEIRSSSPSAAKVRLNAQALTVDNTKRATGIFSLTTSNTVSILNELNTPVLTWNSDEDIEFQQIIAAPTAITLPNIDTGILSVEIPLFTDNKAAGISKKLGDSALIPTPCNEPIPSNRNTYEVQSIPGKEFLRLTSKDSSQCITLFFKELEADHGYLLEIDSRSRTGNNPLFTIYNKEKVAYQEEYIYNTDTFQTYSYIIPPTFSNEIGYDMQIENVSENNTPSTNDFASISFIRIPYNYLKSIEVRSTTAIPQATTLSVTDYTVSHPTATNYTITTPKTTENTTLVLSQAYSSGWKAYRIQNAESRIMNMFPFLFGKELKEHVMINNWANGWKLADSQEQGAKSEETIIIVFLPQYFQYVGFILLPIPLILLLLLRLKNRKNLY